MYKRSHGRRRWHRRYRRKNQHLKKTRSRYQVAKIAQQVVNYNLETKVFDQYCVDYPYVTCNHNLIVQLFDNLTRTNQGLSDEPASVVAKNRIGSSIRPTRLWIKGLIQLNALTSGFPITRCLVRLVLVRRNILQTGGTAQSLPTGSPPHYTQNSQTNLAFAPNRFLCNFDNRQCTVVYDKVHGVQVGALTQSDVAPGYAARGNSIAKTFDLNINIKKWTRGRVDYSFRELTDPPGLSIPKKYAFQLYAIPWISTAYDPDYTGSVPAVQILAQSRLYFKDG